MKRVSRPLTLWLIAFALLVAGLSWSRSRTSDGGVRSPQAPARIDTQAAAPAQLEVDTPAEQTESRRVPEPSESARAMSGIGQALRKPDGRAERPDTIVVTLVRAKDGADHPLAGALVQLWDPYPGPDYGRLEGRPLAQRESDADGRVLFEDVKPGKYSVAATVEGEGPYVTCCLLTGASGGYKDAILRLGSAAVHGTVYDELGRPLQGQVLCLQFVPGAGTPQWVRRVSDAWGQYSCPGIPGGLCMLIVKPSADRPQEAWPRQTLSFGLAEAQSFQLDIGSRAGLVHWHGTLRRPKGEALRGAPILSFEHSAEMPSVFFRAEVDEQGEFDVRLPAGSWTPLVIPVASRSVLRRLPVESVEGADLLRDLRVPETNLHGRVIDASTRLRPLSADPPLQVRVRRGGMWAGREEHACPVDAEGRYHADALGPGEWVVSCEPLPLTVEGGVQALQIDAQETERELNLEVEQP